MYQRLPYHGHCCSTKGDIGLNNQPFSALLSLFQLYSALLCLSQPYAAFLNLTEPFSAFLNDHPEVTANSSDFKFRGRGQPSPVGECYVGVLGSAGLRLRAHNFNSFQVISSDFKSFQDISIN